MLRELEAPHHEAQRALGRLASRAGHPVVELRVLERREVQGQRFFEDHFVHALSEERAKELLARGEAPLSQGEKRDETKLDGDPGQRLPLVFCGPGLRGAYHRIDDELADPRGAGWKDARNQAEQPEREAQTATGRPHQRHAVLELSKHAEQLWAVQDRARCHRASLRRTPGPAIAH